MKPVPLPEDPTARAEVLRQFANLWVAVLNDAVVAAGDTPDQVFRMLDEAGLEKASVTRVADPGRGVAVGLG